MRLTRYAAAFNGGAVTALAVVLALALIASGCAADGGPDQGAVPTGVYRSEDYHWQVRPGPGFTVGPEAGIGNGGDRHGVMVVFRYGEDPSLSSGGSFGQAQVGIGAIEQEARTTPRGFLAQAPTLNREMRADARSGSEGLSLDIIHPYRETKLNGYPALVAAFRLSGPWDGNEGRITLRCQEYLLAHGGNRYSIGLRSSEDEWPATRAALERLTSTFELIDE